MWDAHNGMGWWMVFAGIWMVLFWGLIIGAIAWLISRAAGRGGGGESRSSPMDIARERYARGELTREEFERITEDLRRA